MAHTRLTAGSSSAANGTICLGRLPDSSARNLKCLIPCEASCLGTIAPVFDRSCVNSSPRIDLKGPSTVSPNIHNESPEGSTVLVAPSAPVTPTLLSRNCFPRKRTEATSELSDDRNSDDSLPGAAWQKTKPLTTELVQPARNSRLEQFELFMCGNRPMHQLHDTHRLAAKTLCKTASVCVMIECGKPKCFNPQPNGAASRFQLEPHIGPPAPHVGVEDVCIDRRHIGGRAMGKDATFHTPVNQQHAGITWMKRTSALTANSPIQFTTLTAHLVEMQLQNSGRIRLIERNDRRVRRNAPLQFHSLEKRSQFRFESFGGQFVLLDRCNRRESKPSPVLRGFAI